MNNRASAMDVANRQERRAVKHRCRSPPRMALRTRVPCSRRLGLPRPRRACTARGTPRRSKLSKNKKTVSRPYWPLLAPASGREAFAGRPLVAAGTCRASPLLRRPAATRQHTVIIHNYECLSRPGSDFFCFRGGPERARSPQVLFPQEVPESKITGKFSGIIFRNRPPATSTLRAGSEKSSQVHSRQTLRILMAALIVTLSTASSP